MEAESSAVEVQHKRPGNLNDQIMSAIPFIMDLIIVLIRICYVIGETIYRFFYPRPLKPVKNEIVLITGAGHGIGRELALLYASKGATVIGWDINEATINETINEINDRGYPNKAYAYCCDVSKRDKVFEIAEKVQKDVGDVSILINNAGVMPAKKFLDHTQEDVERIFQINIYAQIWTLQAFLPAMKKKNHGHVVALSSCAGLVGLENLSIYCGSKAAVVAVMEAADEECRMEKSKVRFTTICPYMVDTGLCKKPRIRFEKLLPLVPPNLAAKSIMRAQRSNAAKVTIPGFIMSIIVFARLLPQTASQLVKDFFDSGVDADL